MSKRVLMIGWEYPPAIAGGLGVVTHALFGALRAQTDAVELLLPGAVRTQVQVPGIVQIGASTADHGPYVDAYANPAAAPSPATKQQLYANVWQARTQLAHDAIVAHDMHGPYALTHAHDWLTAEAALQLKLQRGVPYILHVHATQVDRTGDFDVQDAIWRAEQYAMQNAAQVVAVSQYTAQIIEQRYGINRDKITVLLNAYKPEKREIADIERHWPKDKNEFWVLFIGRLTLQKGPDWFVKVAAEVATREPRAKFLIAGKGDMEPELRAFVAEHTLEDTVRFLGFVNEEQRDGLYRFSDCCIIPSVSEPFGLTALEAVAHQTPLIISPNCGAVEVIEHKIVAPHWDVALMADWVITLCRKPELRRTLRHHASHTLPNLTWPGQAHQLRGLYNQLLS